MTTDLVVRSTVRELVTAWNETAATLRTSFAALVAAETRLNAVFSPGSEWSGIRIETNSRDRCHFDDPAACLDRMRRSAWMIIVERLELRRLLSVSRWKQLEQAINAGEMPELTEENVAAFVEGHAGNLSEILRESVREVFDWLRPRANSQAAGYKTNDRVEIGRKVVLMYMVDEGYTGAGFRVAYRCEQELTAMENVFSALDGRGSIAKSYRSELSNTIEASGAHGQGQTRYFRFKCHKNRNLHLEFLRPDLLRTFNAIAGGKNLRPGDVAPKEEAHVYE